MLEFIVLNLEHQPKDPMLDSAFSANSLISQIRSEHRLQSMMLNVAARSPEGKKFLGSPPLL